MATNTEQHYSLRWNDYTVKIVTAFQSLRDEEDFVDVTVACDGHHYSAHKMVLSACSPYFRSLLRANPCQHPIVILKDVGHIEMERLLEFMYNGEVNIAQDQLAAFLKTAESLRIRGLAGSSEEIDQNLSRDSSHNIYSCMTNTIGNIPGRSSPNVSFSQECKDDEITSDGVFHISSPIAKRRKRISDTHVITNVDNSTSHTNDSLTGDSLIDESTGTDHVLELEDHRLDRRELKSEPSDALGEVYTNSSDLTHDHHNHHDAVPGPSGSVMVNQDDGLASNATPLGGAVCEALNLSLRSTPAIPNGSSPASVSIHNMQRSLYHPPSSSAIHMTPLDEDVDIKVHPLFMERAIMVPAIHSDAQLAYDIDAIDDLVPETKVFPLGQPLVMSLPECSVATTSELKTKVYPCPECLKVFRHPMSLHHHRHVHKGTYTCQSCGKVFSRRWDLHRHIHRSKMGCRRPNHTTPETHHGMLRNPSFDLNNPPSN